jgi:hypothetical protein
VWQIHGVERKPNNQTKHMKLVTKLTLSAMAITASAALVIAQDGAPNSEQTPPARGRHFAPPQAQDGNGPRPGVPHRPPPPLFAALDANHDGVIDEGEIANASNALKTLDKNGDGKLTMDELMPPPGPGGRPGHRPPPPQSDGNGAPGEASPNQ